MATSSQWLLSMARTVDHHLDEESAENYILGTLSARTAAQIEKHLLICEPCRQSVAASDTYVAAMQKAAAKLRKAERKRKRKAIRKAGG
jgi:anti-sigma-K factor RskA